MRKIIKITNNNLSENNELLDIICRRENADGIFLINDFSQLRFIQEKNCIILYDQNINLIQYSAICHGHGVCKQLRNSLYIPFETT